MRKVTIKDKYSKSIWKEQEKKFTALEKKVKIPDEKLRQVDFVFLQKKEDFEKIPDTGGCYWLWTDEPVRHRFHKHRIPRESMRGEIIYNGIAKDNVRQRIKRHLLGEPHAQWSAISLDIYCHKSKSHRKKVMSPSGKVPYVFLVGYDGKGFHKSIRDRDLLGELSFSKKEKEYIKNSKKRVYFFRNGINVFEKKHKKYKFRIYFITGLRWLYLEYIEKNWRERYGLPKLCSYSSGR